MLDVQRVCFFSVLQLGDEVSDISNQEQLSLVLGLVDVFNQAKKSSWSFYGVVVKHLEKLYQICHQHQQVID